MHHSSRHWLISSGLLCVVWWCMQVSRISSKGFWLAGVLGSVTMAGLLLYGPFLISRECCWGHSHFLITLCTASGTLSRLFGCCKCHSSNFASPVGAAGGTLLTPHLLWVLLGSLPIPYLLYCWGPFQLLQTASPFYILEL